MERIAERAAMRSDSFVQYGLTAFKKALDSREAGQIPPDPVYPPQFSHIAGLPTFAAGLARLART